MILQFRITHPEGQTSYTKILELKWDFPLRKGGQLLTDLKASLEGVHGVEFVNTGRYTCFVGYAEHVVKPDDLAHEIAEMLEDDKDLIYAYNRNEARPEYGAAERTKVDVAIPF